MSRLPRVLLPALALVAAGWLALDPLTFSRGSTITVEGTSNVHGWSCTSTQVAGTANAATAAAGWTGLSALTLSVPVSSLDCRNRTMNGKLRDAFGAANPTVRFTLGNARVSTPRNGAFTVQATGTLAMAGQSRPLTVTAAGTVTPSGQYRFTGSVPVTMSQWGMRPPTALAGTMRTGDRVTVRFDVTLAR